MDWRLAGSIGHSNFRPGAGYWTADELAAFLFDMTWQRSGHWLILHFCVPTMLIMPGAEYISSCLWPFLSKYSMAEKSFLSSCAFFRNSDLET